MTPRPSIARHLAAGIVLRVVFLLLSATAAWPVAATDAGATGPVVVIGGALEYDNAAVWSRLVELAGGPDARWVVLATASSTPDDSAARIIAAFARRGAVAEHVRVAPRIAGQDVATEVANPKWIERVRAARGVYFAGGWQERIVDTLQPGGRETPLLRAIRELQARGGVIAGSSAGAAIMSTVMFRDAEDVLAVMKGRMRDGQEVDRGLGFVGPGVFVDQHFLANGRIGRMLPLMLARGYRFGLGVDENTAAIVTGDVAEIVGARGVMLVDLVDARRDATLPAFNVRGARIDYLEHGDRVNLQSGAITPAPAKRLEPVIDPASREYSPSSASASFQNDMLGDATILRAMIGLMDSRDLEVRGLAFAARPAADDPEPTLGFEFRLYKRDGTLGWYDGSRASDHYTFANIGLDVLPVRFAQPLYTPLAR